MIGIRADGNKKIGIGHVMRCMTVGDAMKQLGEDVIFFLADCECVSLVESRGFRCCVLDSLYDDLNSETEKLMSLLDEFHVNKLLIDSYYVTPEYFNVLREKVAIAYLDDMDLFEYPVDILINYNVFAQAKDYPYVTENMQCLIGPKYAPVRKEFANVCVCENKAVENILITLGGSDQYNLSLKIAKVLLECTNCRLHVVCGPFNRNREELVELAESNERILLHENVKEMWKLMGDCELAVSAAGSTMCELATARVPSVTFSFVDNQQKIAVAFGEKNAAVSVGHYECVNETIFLNDIKEAVLKMISDAEFRGTVKKNAYKLVDGAGAERIARAIMEQTR